MLRARRIPVCYATGAVEVRGARHPRTTEPGVGILPSQVGSRPGTRPRGAGSPGCAISRILFRVQIDRRRFLRLSGDLALLALLPGWALAEALRAVEEGAEGAGFFLSAPRMRALRALCAHWVPGPPEDPDPGAEEAGVAHYIDLLLGAFELGEPRIFAGGPFSNREGGGTNFFLEWLPLDALQERAWRTRIEGSRGLAEREWNGPVKGWQAHYAEGLDALDHSAQRYFGSRFAELARWKRSAVLGWLPGGPDDAFLGIAFRHTMEGMYGAPEYGGNRDRVGWRYTRWPGDHQPRAYTLQEISEPDPDQAEAVARARARAREVRSEDG